MGETRDEMTAFVWLLQINPVRDVIPLLHLSLTLESYTPEKAAHTNWATSQHDPIHSYNLKSGLEEYK